MNVITIQPISLTSDFSSYKHIQTARFAFALIEEEDNILHKEFFGIATETGSPEEVKAGLDASIKHIIEQTDADYVLISRDMDDASTMFLSMQDTIEEIIPGRWRVVHRHVLNEYNINHTEDGKQITEWLNKKFREADDDDQRTLANAQYLAFKLALFYTKDHETIKNSSPPAS